jgi:hypothetical protein
MDSAYLPQTSRLHDVSDMDPSTHSKLINKDASMLFDISYRLSRVEISRGGRAHVLS